MKNLLTGLFAKAILILVVVVFLIQPPISAQTLNDFLEKIFIDADGNAQVSWKFSLIKSGKDIMLLPWNFSSDKVEQSNFFISQNEKTIKLKVDSSSKSIVEIVTSEGTKFVRVDISVFNDSDKIEIKFNKQKFYDLKNTEVEEFGNYTLKKRFVNTTPTKLKNFSSEIIVPAGFVITSVEETIPKQASDDPVSPFALNRTKNQNSVIIKSPGLKLGDNVFIKFRFKEDAKSPVLLIFLSIVAVLYLVYFRDVLKPANGKSETGNK
jgi:hypothetical protein